MYEDRIYNMNKASHISRVRLRIPAEHYICVCCVENVLTCGGHHGIPNTQGLFIYDNGGYTGHVQNKQNYAGRLIPLCLRNLVMRSNYGAEFMKIGTRYQRVW